MSDKGQSEPAVARLAIALIAVMAMAFTVDALGHDVRSGGLQISHPWARATAGVARNGAAYLAIVNRGREADRLVRARNKKTALFMQA